MAAPARALSLRPGRTDSPIQDSSNGVIGIVWLLLWDGWKNE